MARTSEQMKSKSCHYGHFVLQKFLIEKFFPVFECSLKHGVLTCTGGIRPVPEAEEYTVGIRYAEWGIPHVKIQRPNITPRKEIHMYRSGELCLYHPPTEPWCSMNDLHKTIIPWTAEWLVYYELFLTEGKWLGPEVRHGDLDLTRRGA